MFRKLQTRVTFLYAALFVTTLLAVAQAVAPMVTANAVNATKAELAASRTVFDRIFAMKSRELQGNAELLAKDFGFTSAIATGDAPPEAPSGERIVVRRMATITRAGLPERVWTRFAGNFELAELYDVSFTDRRKL